jgi:hypothetical protein
LRALLLLFVAACHSAAPCRPPQPPGKQTAAGDDGLNASKYFRCIPKAAGNTAARCEEQLGKALRETARVQAATYCANVHMVRCVRDKCERECVNDAFVDRAGTMTLAPNDARCPGQDACALQTSTYDCGCSCPEADPTAVTACASR